MIETILTIMLAGISTVGVFLAVMVIIDIYRVEDEITHNKHGL